MSGSIRIIGGRWKGRKLPVLDAPGLRPTGDRLRETLFNWLSGFLVEAQCLDAFSGTGALGLEAISRGAASCALWELNAQTVCYLKKVVDTLEAQSFIKVIKQDTVSAFSKKCTQPYDIIFCDPPFGKVTWSSLLSDIAENGWVKSEGFLYIEAANDQPIDFGIHWQVHRSKVAAGVRIHLLRKA